MENTSVTANPQIDSEQGTNEIPYKFQHLINKSFFMMTSTKDFEEKGSCDSEGSYFMDVEHLFNFLEDETHLREVLLPLSAPDFECFQDDRNKWRATMINFGKKYDLADADTFKHLVELGIDIKVNNNVAIRWASGKGYLQVVKYLVELGADCCDYENHAVECASQFGHLETVKYLVEQGADIQDGNNYPIRLASKNGHFDVVKFLVENGADFRADKCYAIKWAFKNGHKKIYKYLLKCWCDLEIKN
jgi:hypothetical protein